MQRQVLLQTWLVGSNAACRLFLVWPDKVVFPLQTRESVLSVESSVFTLNVGSFHFGLVMSYQQ